MGDSITIKAILDSTGFAAGSKKLEGAVKGLGSAAKNVGNTVQRSFNGMMGNVKRIVPMLIGVGSAYGIISKAVSAFMSENQSLTAQMSSMWSSLGNLLGPIITQIINWVSTAVSWFLSFLKLLGVASAGAKKAAKAAGGGAAALKKTIAGFDELNLLQDNSGGGGGGGAGGISDKELPEWLKEMADLLKKKEFEEAGRLLARQLNKLVQSIDWAGIGKKLYEGLHGALQFLHGALDEFDWAALGKAIHDFIVNIDFKQLIKDLGTILFDAIKGAIKFAWGLLGNDNDSLLKPLMDRIDKLKAEVEKAIDRISDAIGVIWASVKPKIEWFITDGLPKVIDFLIEILDLVGDIADLLSGKLKLSEFVEDLSGVQKVVLLIVSALTIIGTILSGLSAAAKVIAIFKNWAAVIKTVTSALGLVGKALSFLSGPVGVVIAAIGILVGAFAHLWQTSEEFRDNITETWNGIKSVITQFIDGIKERFDVVVPYLKQLWEDLKQAWEMFCQLLAPVFEGAFELVKADLELVTSIILGILDVFIGIFTGDWERAWSGVKGIFTSVWDYLVERWDIIVTTLKNVADKFLGFFGGDWDTLWTNVSAKATEIWEGLKEGWANLWENFPGVISGAWEGIKTAASNIWNGIVDGFKTFFGVEEGGESSVFKDLAASVLEGFKTGLVAAWGIISGAVSAVWDGIINGFKSLFGIGEGESTVFSEFGGNIVEGLKKGIGVAWNAAIGAINTLWGGIKSGFTTALGISGDGTESSLSEFGGNMISGMANRISSAWESVKGTVQSVWDNVKEGASKIWNWLFGGKEQNEDTVVESASEAAISASEGAQSEIGVIWAGIDQDVATAITNITTNISSFVTSNTTSLTSFSTDVETAFSNSFMAMGTTVDTFSTETTSKFTQMESSVVADTNSMVNALESAWQGAVPVVKSSLAAIVSACNANFSVMASNAYVWGADIIISLNNGIVAAWNTLASTISAVAAMIRSYLGFSEPEKGPLSNFHTFMPDMMKLMADGIEDNIPLAERAAKNVAQAVSDEIQGGDYSFGEVKAAEFEGAMDGFSDKIVDGFAKLIERLQEIADNVTFSMPTVAGGGILPYGVDSGLEGMGRSKEESEMVEAIQELRDLIIDFRNAVDNMQWVAQFGDLRAVAQRVSTIQKQIERARG